MSKFAIAPTDHDWFYSLRESNIDFVNFWTPTPWNIKGLHKGDIFFMLLKSPIRKIGGYGYFEYYTEMDAGEAWRKFGIGNGVRSYYELLERTRKYASKNSRYYSKNVYLQIGCIVLSRCVFLDEKNFFTPEDKGLSFPPQIVKLKYFSSTGIVIDRDEEIIPFKLVDEDLGIIKNINVKERIGQSEFRNKLLSTYSRCVISREKCKEVLEAAHIQKYINESSNHLQNGILLRADLHKLFDNGLITILPNYKIKTSKYLNSSEYKVFDNRKIFLPLDVRDYPSIKALEWHNKAVFRD